MSEVKLTEKDLAILDVIKTNVTLISPTEIGMKLGKDYNSASAYCTLSLKRLMDAGKVIKIKCPKVKYKLSSKQ